MTWLDDLSDDERSRLRPAPVPGSLVPMLATLEKGPVATTDGWTYERKLDGQRILAFCERDEVRLRSRTDKPADGAYPEVVDALHGLVTSDCVLDGEVVAFDDRGATSFSLLQGRMGRHDPVASRRSGIDVVYCVFDVVHLDGIDLAGLPLARRVELIGEAFDPAGPLRIAERHDDGAGLFATACAEGWEGIIAKRLDSTYQPRRSPAWRKHKCEAGQELVVGGWTEPKGSRTDLGALLVGHHVGDDLVYAGKVGTGFDAATLRSLGARLRDLEVPTSPFAPHPMLPRRDVHWAAPQLVAQVGFAEWTGDGLLRHPRFQGLREDKDPLEISRESP